MMIIILALSREGSSKNDKREMVMKSIVSALIALSVLAGAAGSAYAADNYPRDFWEQQSRNLP